MYISQIDILCVSTAVHVCMNIVILPLNFFTAASYMCWCAEPAAQWRRKSGENCKYAKNFWNIYLVKYIWICGNMCANEYRTYTYHYCTCVGNCPPPLCVTECGSRCCYESRLCLVTAQHCHFCAAPLASLVGQFNSLITTITYRFFLTQFVQGWRYHTPISYKKRQ